MEIKKIKHRGIETAYRDTGGEGIPFLLVHGFTGSMLDFRDEITGLNAEGRRVITVDQRGHGDTTNTNNLDDYVWATLVADLLSFIDALRVSKLDILGHSLGGMVVMRTVLASPELFRSVILMDTSAEDLGGDFGIPEEMHPAIREQGVQMLKEFMHEREVSSEEQNGIDLLGHEEHHRRIKQKLVQMDPDAFIGLQPQFRLQQGILKALKTLALPTTIMVGEADAPFRKPSDHMHETIPGSTLVKIPNAHHCPQYENAPAWRETIAAHFARVEG